jgi:hypothetical protein
MTAQREPEMITQATPEEHGGSHRHGHGWMMIACCVPMLVIAVVLVATGVASPGFLVVAVGCMVMMAVMMAGMGHGSDHRA